MYLLLKIAHKAKTTKEVLHLKTNGLPRVINVFTQSVGSFPRCYLYIPGIVVLGGRICRCYSDEENGYWTGGNCDECVPGFLKPTCVECESGK